jgi:hypothetical protein
MDKPAIKNNEPNQICMKVTLTTLTKVAKDTTGTKAVFCTNSSNLPACLLFRKDLEALAVGADGLHPMLKKPTAAKLAYVLMAEARDGDDNTSSIILDSPQFAKIARRPITAEITFPIKQKFHFNLRW